MSAPKSERTLSGGSSDEWIELEIAFDVQTPALRWVRILGAKVSLPRKRAFGESYAELLRGDELEPQGQLR
jgi:hypothetical protein